MKNKFILLLLSLCLTSCAFNKQFFQPTKFPENMTTLCMNSQNDTTTVSINKKDFQPIFTKSNGDTIISDFEIKSVVFKSSSGNNLNGWILQSKKVKFNDITILNFHGNGGNLYNQFQNMIPFLKYGYKIFVFDYSGYGFSTGKPDHNNIIDDGLSSLSFIKQRKEFENSKIVVYGQSLGGYLGATIAPPIENKIDGLVLEGAFSNRKDMGADVAGILGRILVSQKDNALKTIKDYHKPLLVIHSTEDEIVPYKLGEKIFDAANQPKEMYTIKECHICGPIYYGKEIAEKIEQMVK